MVPMVDVRVLTTIRERSVEIGTRIRGASPRNRSCFCSGSRLRTDADCWELDWGGGRGVHFKGVDRGCVAIAWLVGTTWRTMSRQKS